MVPVLRMLSGSSTAMDMTGWSSFLVFLASAFGCLSAAAGWAVPPVASACVSGSGLALVVLGLVAAAAGSLIGSTTPTTPTLPDRILISLWARSASHGVIVKPYMGGGSSPSLDVDEAL